jgi:hypothetical protein
MDVWVALTEKGLFLLETLSFEKLIMVVVSAKLIVPGVLASELGTLISKGERPLAQLYRLDRYYRVLATKRNSSIRAEVRFGIRWSVMFEE